MSLNNQKHKNMKIEGLMIKYRPDYRLDGGIWINGNGLDSEGQAMDQIKEWRGKYKFEFEMRITVTQTFTFSV